MNKLPLEKRVQIVECLVNGLGLNATSIAADVSVNTVAKLQMDLGKMCLAFHERTVNQLAATKEVFCNAIWGFSGINGRAMPSLKLPSLDDIWTFMAIDKDSQLIISYSTGIYQPDSALAVLRDVSLRVKGSYYLTADSAKLYLDMAEQAFDKVGNGTASDLEFSALGLSSMLRNKKSYDESALGPRQAKFLKKVESYSNALSFHIVYHNFFKESKISGTTSAMRAGLTEKPLVLVDFMRLHD